jgi:hypothetical protein
MAFLEFLGLRVLRARVVLECQESWVGCQAWCLVV